MLASFVDDDYIYVVYVYHLHGVCAVTVVFQLPVVLKRKCSPIKK